MRKTILIAAIALMFSAGAPGAHALSCLPLDMYLDTVVAEESGETFVFTGTATGVTKDHTQVVTVSEAHKGYVPSKVWVTHPYSTDWQYFCSNGPAKAGETTVFLVRIDAYGSWSVTQTLDADSAEAKDFVKELADAKTDAGITEATSRDRANEVLESIKGLLAALGNLFAEFRYWQSQAK
jgi:hypothetical protein